MVSPRIRMASCNLSSFSLDKQAILLQHINREGLNVVNVQETHWSHNEFKDQVSKAAKFFQPCSIFGSHCNKDDKAAGVITIIKGTLQRKD